MKNNTKLLVDFYNNWYNKLNAGERRLLFVFTAVSVLSFYFAVFLKPAMDEVIKIEKQQQENQSQIGRLKLQYPNAANTKQEIELIKQNLKNLKLKNFDIESKLISISQEQQLLTEVIKHAQELSIDLESVKEDIKEEKNGFARLYIDLEFISSYKKAVLYIRKIESISPFVRIKKIGLAQFKNEPLTLVEVSIGLSAMLSYESNNFGQLSLSLKEPDSEIEDLKDSPFTPRFVTKKAKRENLKVTGITYRKGGLESTVIINGTIVKIGGQIEGVKVEQILPNYIIVDNGVEKETLALEK